MKGVAIGDTELAVIAGPCAVESREQIFTCARAVAEAGGRFLRGGAFKTRTSPKSFRGLGVEGFELLRQAADAFDLQAVSEVQSPEQVEVATRYVDVLQVGTRNMQVIPLLEELGRCGRPVLLKRGFGSTIDEWLHAAEYILLGGNDDVILCERGIRSFEPSTRFTLDISAVPLARARLGLPVIVDPSHASGRRDLVLPLARAAIAVGADGLLIETHPDPDRARSDGPQSIDLDHFHALIAACRPIATALGRTMADTTET
jgi:3-deoxy-7-phosphoheptulonate synthase